MGAAEFILFNESRMFNALNTALPRGASEAEPMRIVGWHKQENKHAAVFLDGGFDGAHRIVEIHLGPLIEEIQSLSSSQDFKSQLQELVQVNQQQMPDYSVIAENGPDHDKTFCVRLLVLDLITEGRGKSKKQAEQDAAKNALDILRNGRS